MQTKVIQIQSSETPKRAIYNDCIKHGYFMPAFTSHAITIKAMLRIKKTKHFIIYHSREITKAFLKTDQLNAPVELAYVFIQATLKDKLGKILPFEKTPDAEFVRVILVHLDPDNRLELCKPHFEKTQTNVIIRQPHRVYAWNYGSNSLQNKYNALITKIYKIRNLKVYIGLKKELEEARNDKFSRWLKNYIEHSSPEVRKLIEGSPEYQTLNDDDAHEKLVWSFIPPQNRQAIKEVLNSKTTVAFLPGHIKILEKNQIYYRADLEKIKAAAFAADTEKKAQEVLKMCQNLRIETKDQKLRRSQDAMSNYSNNESSNDSGEFGSDVNEQLKRLIEQRLQAEREEERARQETEARKNARDEEKRKKKPPVPEMPRPKKNKKQKPTDSEHSMISNKDNKKKHGLGAFDDLEEESTRPPPNPADNLRGKFGNLGNKKNQQPRKRNLSRE